MSLTDKILAEILREIKALHISNLELSNKFDLMVKRERNIGKTLEQMARNLREYQAIVDFALKDNTNNNRQILRELKSGFTKLSVLFNPELVGAYRPGTKIISSENDYVSVLNKSYLIRKAEMSLNPAYTSEAAWYRIGYLATLGSTQETFDEGYHTLITSPQQLRVVSTSASDTTGGTGVQQVLVGGIDSTNTLRIFETVTLNGTSQVITANQFSSFDILNSSAVGSNGSAVGTISVTNIANTVTYGAMAVGNNAWRSGKFFTDNESGAYVDSWTFDSYGSAVRAELAANHLSGNPNALIARAFALTNNSSAQIVFPIPIKVPKRGQVQIRGIAKQSNTEVATSFEIHTRLE